MFLNYVFFQVSCLWTILEDKQNFILQQKIFLFIIKIFYLQFLFKFLLIRSRLRLYSQAVDSNCRERAVKTECSKIVYLRCSDWKGISCQPGIHSNGVCFKIEYSIFKCLQLFITIFIAMFIAIFIT